MRISREILYTQAQNTGFRPEVLEKVGRLFDLLETLQEHSFLRGRLALKGGTALNLFVLDAPRLSIDIDLNYIGAEDLETMLEERPNVEKALQAVFHRQGFETRRMPREHAGGKWSLRYEKAFGGRGNLEVDLNFMHRVPLWDITLADSQQVGSWKASGVPVLDIHELASGKLAALFARTKARDLFDSHKLLSAGGLELSRLRTGFVVYGAMNRKDWRTVSIDDVKFDVSDLENQLAPTLRKNMFDSRRALREFGSRVENECREKLSVLLPFSSEERNFLDLLLDRGKIEPGLLTGNVCLQTKILSQPLLKWKARNVRQYKGLPDDSGP